MRKTENMTLEHLGEIVEILALIESHGSMLGEKPTRETITAEAMNDLMLSIMATKRSDEKSKEDFGRQIRNAKDMFNKLRTSFEVKTSSDGYSFAPVVADSTLKNDPAYDAMLLFALALLTLRGHANLDTYTQPKAQQFPLSFLLAIDYAICGRYSVAFDYTNRRRSEVSGFVPSAITLRASHWYVIGFNTEKDKEMQYLIHSMEKLRIEKQKDGLPRAFPDAPRVDLGDFYAGVFGHAVLSGAMRVIRFELEVPNHLVSQVRKRRSEGTWADQGKHWVWTVDAYDPDEVFAYLLRWGGDIKIRSPESVRQDFAERLRGMLKSLE